VQEDDVEAVKWFRLAAEQGDASAQYNLGVMYTNGEGVPKDDVTAARWYRLAAALSMDMLSNGERDDSFQIV
jgi:TPR repeat protein